MRGRGGTATSSNNGKSPWFNNTRAWANGEFHDNDGRVLLRVPSEGTLGAPFTAQVARLVEQRLRKRKLPFSELRINLSEPVRAEPIRTLAIKRACGRMNASRTNTCGNRRYQEREGKRKISTDTDRSLHSTPADRSDSKKQKSKPTCSFIVLIYCDNYLIVICVRGSCINFIQLYN
jgi:hypothetical protein